MNKKDTIELLDSLPNGHYICSKTVSEDNKKLFIFEKEEYFFIIGNEDPLSADDICHNSNNDFTPLEKIRPITINS